MRIFTGEIEGDKRLVIKLESATEGIGAMKSGQAGLVDDEVLKEIGIDLYLDQETPGAQHGNHRRT